MKYQISLLLLAVVLITSNGCANGPMRKFFKGAACNSCNPPFGLFNRNESTAGTCANGTCGGVAPIDGTMVGGQQFGSGINGQTNNPPAVNGDSYPYPGTGIQGSTGGTGLGDYIVPNTSAPQPGPGR